MNIRKALALQGIKTLEDLEDLVAKVEKQVKGTPLEKEIKEKLRDEDFKKVVDEWGDELQEAFKHESDP